jgi:hypothetical protein
LSNGGLGGASAPSTTQGSPPPHASSTSPRPPLSSSSSSAVAPGQPQAKRPGQRRKPKQQLAELPSAADSRRAGKKLTTLEKSALDWRAHVRDNDNDASRELPRLASKLEANRRGCGYLEKVEFLQRVGDRKNQMLETNRDHKRRRG